MTSKKRQFGDIGERYANDLLLKTGYTILDNNYRIKNIGETDIVAKKGQILFFFEVKTRNVKRETNFPTYTSLNQKKRKNLRKICQLYLIDKRYPLNQKWQVDALLIGVGCNGLPDVEHLENILWEEYY